MLKDKKIFITGGAGFIGSTLIGRLIDDNEITVYDNFRRDALSDKPYANRSNLKIIHGDILNFQMLQKKIGNAQIIIHCAAIADIDTVVISPTETMRVNMIGTANILESAKGLDNFERFIDLRLFNNNA